jgi:hypothetical protein
MDNFLYARLAQTPRNEFPEGKFFLALALKMRLETTFIDGGRVRTGIGQVADLHCSFNSSTVFPVLPAEIFNIFIGPPSAMLTPKFARIPN